MNDDKLSTMMQKRTASWCCDDDDDNVDAVHANEATLDSRDCQIDPTCCLCARCFEASAHAKHNYRMSVSGGKGGFCDCGDSEAWTSHPTCSVHSEAAASAASGAPDPVKLAEEQGLFSSQARIVIRAMVTFIRTVLLADDDEKIPERLVGLCPAEALANHAHALVVWNDEVHDFDDVMGRFREALHLTNGHARALTEFIDADVCSCERSVVLAHS